MRISDWSSDVCSSDLRRCCGPGSWWPDRMPTEFTLIDAIARRAATRDDVVLGIGDDAAVLAVPAGSQLVVAMDTLNAGVHFPDDTAPADIGWKALAVNLSDLRSEEHTSELQSLM